MRKAILLTMLFLAALTARAQYSCYQVTVSNGMSVYQSLTSDGTYMYATIVTEGADNMSTPPGCPPLRVRRHTLRMPASP
jgi:hypothetical protein